LPKYLTLVTESNAIIETYPRPTDYMTYNWESWTTHGVFEVGQLNGVTEIYPGVTLVAMVMEL